MSNELRAILEGFVEELNRRWNGTAFYFWVDHTIDRVSCQQSIAVNKQRQYLRIALSKDVVQLEKQTRDGNWRVKYQLNLADPHCMDHIHDLVKSELSRA